MASRPTRLLPPPRPPHEDDAGHSSIFQQLENWVDHRRGSTSSSSNNAPSEPTIDLSSWSPRSYAMTTRPGLPHSSLITYSVPPIPNQNSSTRHELSLLLGTTTEDLNCLGIPTQMRLLLSIAPLTIQSPIQFMAALLKTTQMPESKRGDPRGPPASASLYPDLIPTQHERGIGKDFQAASNTASAELSRTVPCTKIRNLNTLLVSEQALAQHLLPRPSALPTPIEIFFPTQAHQLSSAKQGPTKDSTNYGESLPHLFHSERQGTYFDIQKQSPPKPPFLMECPAQHQLSLTHCTEVYTDFDTTDLSQSTDNFSPQISQTQTQQAVHSTLKPLKTKLQPTRRSERLQKRKSSTQIAPLFSLKNKTPKRKITFNLEPDSHHQPLQVSSVLQVLQASGVQISENTEQMIQEAIEQDQKAQSSEDTTPTTPLHDVIPPLAVPGAHMLL